MLLQNNALAELITNLKQLEREYADLEEIMGG